MDICLFSMLWGDGGGLIIKQFRLILNCEGLDGLKRGVCACMCASMCCGLNI